MLGDAQLPTIPAGLTDRVLVPHALHLPLQHLHLVPEHQELGVLLILEAASGSEETADQEVEEREQDGAPSGRGGRMLPVPQTPNRGN